ncbi:MAG: hypothetical protein GY947_22305 [Rhodobacteraceae bacterium]|nr:hypothetical protein [Paracoccaceae bacterium]
MTLSAAEDTATQRPNRARGVRARLSGLVNIAIAMVLALTPVTAILVLGWLMRIMRRETAIALYRYGAPEKRRKLVLTRLAAAPELTHIHRFPGWWSGLVETVRAGLKATVALAAATLPFGALLLLSWWAGWENSFNKGYEQAWVGPLLALLGLLLAIFVLVHLPMALAHHAAERRVGALLELRTVRQLIRRVPWRYMVFTLCMVAASAPVYLSQIVPTFIEGVFPKLATAGPEELRAFALRWHVGFSVYLVLVLLLLRRWGARLYARAVLANGGEGGEFTSLVQQSLELPQPGKSKPVGRLARLLTSLIMAASWFGFIAALYVAQFANHAWWSWLNHPILGLPWIFRPL